MKKQAATWVLNLALSAAFAPVSIAFAQQAPGSSSPGGANVPSPVGNNSMMASSPFTDFTMGAVAYVLIIGALVVILLGGGMLILNLGLMSKRDQDHVGGRTPSDVGILKTSIWPRERENAPVLPAEEDEPFVAKARKRKTAA